MPSTAPGFFESTTPFTPKVAADGTWQLTAIVGKPSAAGGYTFTYAESGCASQTGTFTVTASPTASVPAAPSNLTATAVDQHDIKLTWHDNSSDETGFEINNGVTSRNAGANSTTYTWGGLALGTYMCFKIRSYNSVGDSAWDPNVSPWYVCTTTPKPPPPPTASVPAAPSNLTATAVDRNDIKLTWTDNSNNETGFEINNSVTSNDVAANSTTYTWGGLKPGTYMCFKIRSYNSAGDSAWDPNVSPWYVCATTPKPPPPPKTTVPAAPSNLTATAVDPNDIKLTWRDNSNNETGFEINNGVTSSNAGANSTTYTWGGLKPGTYMCFKIRSYNSAGDSAWDPKVSPSHVCTTTPKTDPQPNWAGWSWYPHQGTVSLISAEWKIPQVDCTAPPPPKKAPDISRTAVWVGLWGPNDAGNNRWLPQIGTASLCVAGIPRYFAIYQMYNGAGGGTTPNTLNLKGLQYGDTIQAKVSYAGRHQGRLQFNIFIKDITRNSTAGGYIDTAPNVPLVDAAYQGGAIVEDNGDMGDLAKFDTPITIRNIQVTGDAGGARTRWAMVVSGNQIASTGDVRKGSFSVTWHNY